MNDTQNAPSLSQAQRLKKLAQEGHFSYDVAFAVMGEEKGWTGQGGHQKRHPAEVFPSQLHPETDGGHCRKARNEMQELVRAQKNVEHFFAEEKPAQENEQVW